MILIIQGNYLGRYGPTQTYKNGADAQQDVNTGAYAQT